MMWLLLSACSALCSAAAAVIQKKVLFAIDALAFSFLVSLGVLVLSLPAPVLSEGEFFAVPQTVLLVIAGKSVLGAAAFLCVMHALEKNPISTALPLLGLTPAAAAALSVPVFGESLSIQEYAALALMTAGIYLIERRPGAPRSARVPIAAALLLFALSSVADKLLVSSMRIDPWTVLFYQHGIYAAVFGMIMLMRGRTVSRSLLFSGLPLIAAAAVLTILYRFAQLEATKDAPVALVLAVKRMSIVAASAYGGRLFRDEHLGMKLAGGALIVAAGFLILRYGI
ncbi:MAG: EamA family transporter [Acidobacteriota bacterium]